MGALAMLVAALLASSSVVAASAALSPEPDSEARPAGMSSVSASDVRGRPQVSAGCGPDTVACELPVPAPGCEPRIGVLCIEAFADAALMRWIYEQRPMPPDHTILDVVDGRLLVVGYAHGYGEPDVDVDVVERDNHVSIVLQFDFHREASLDGDDWAPPVIRYGRVVVELDERLGDRAVDVWTSYTPNERSP